MKPQRCPVQSWAKTDIAATTSGLEYKVVRKINAELPKPTAADTVTVMYEGRLATGATFDSSYQRGEPISFGLREVIPGWTEGLQLMKPGEQFLLFLPSRLGYGESGAGADIPPNSDLVFCVELLKFERPDGTTVSAP